MCVCGGGGGGGGLLTPFFHLQMRSPREEDAESCRGKRIIINYYPPVFHLIFFAIYVMFYRHA